MWLYINEIEYIMVLKANEVKNKENFYKSYTHPTKDLNPKYTIFKTQQ